MDITKISDLELAKLINEQRKLLDQTSKNVELLEREIQKRMEVVSSVNVESSDL